MSQALAVRTGSSPHAGVGPIAASPLPGSNAVHVAEALRRAVRDPTLPPVAAPLPQRLKVLAEYVRRIAHAIRQRWRRTGTETALRALDARTLRDIGLDRSEISSMAAEQHGAVAASRIRAMNSLP